MSGFDSNNGFPQVALATPYTFKCNAANPTDAPITFVGDPSFEATGTMALQWTIEQAANDGSLPQLSVSLDGGATFNNTTIGSGSSPQAGINESGSVLAPLLGSAGVIVNLIASGGTASATALEWIVGLTITRNITEKVHFDWNNPLNPLGYNGSFTDLAGNPDTDTLGNLRFRLMCDLGLASQASNPTAGMKLFCNNKLLGAQNYLYRRFMSLATRRFFRWKMVMGQRFYSLKDNDENALSGFHMDPNKTIEWVGIQDTRNVWYPLVAGIPPEVYTMEQVPWRPARYDIKGCIEVYPAPDQVYFLWMRGHFGLMPFIADSDSTTINSELVYLHALAGAKAHYGQPDANDVEAQANAYRAELVAATHKTKRYIPGTGMLPAAVRPTLLHFIGGGPS